MLIVPMLDQGGLERVCAATARLLKDLYDVHLVVFNTAGMIYDVSGVAMTDLHLGAVQGRFGKALNVAKRVRRVRQLKKAAHAAKLQLWADGESGQCAVKAKGHYLGGRAGIWRAWQQGFDEASVQAGRPGDQLHAGDGAGDQPPVSS